MGDWFQDITYTHLPYTTKNITHRCHTILSRDE